MTRLVFLVLVVVSASAAAAAAAVGAHRFDFVDKRTVQSATVYELNVDGQIAGGRSCHAILDGTGALCPFVGRHYDLKPSELDRVLALVNDPVHYDPAQKPTCAVPRQALVISTTKGKQGVDISLECNNVGGRAPSKATKKELALFLRSFGYVQHVPFNLE